MVRLLALAQHQAVCAEVVLGHFLIGVLHLLVVEVNAAARDEPSALAQRLAQPRLDHQVDDALVALQRLDLGGGHRAVQRVAAKQRARSLGRSLGLGLAVHQLGHLVRQHLLGLVDLAALQRAQAPHLVHRQEGQQREALFHVLIVHVAPVLVEVVGRGLLGVEPQRARLGLAHLAAVVRQQQLEGYRERVLALLAADEVRAGQYVAPLVVAAQLHAAAVPAEQLQEVVALHQHVVEFQEGQALLHALLVALGRQHAVDREVHAHLAQEVHVVEVEQPVGVVGDDGLAVGEVEEAAHLRLDALDVVVDLLAGEHLAQLALAGRVADHARAAAHQRDGAVTGLLHVRHRHDRDVMPDVQRVRGGVKADVEGHLLVFQHLVQVVLVNRLRDKASLAQHVQCVLVRHGVQSPYPIISDSPQASCAR